MTVPKTDIGRVLREATPRLMAVDGVIGTAAGRHEGAPCIKVYVADGVSGVERRLPESVGGYPVVVEISGAITPRTRG